MGSVENVKDRALGIEEAENEAKKRVAESIGTSILTEFSKVTTGSNKDTGALGNALTSAVSAGTRVQMRGVLPVERYWRKLERVVDGAANYSYDISVLVKLSKVDYQRAMRQIAEEAAKDEQIKADANAQATLDKIRAQAGSL